MEKNYLNKLYIKKNFLILIFLLFALSCSQEIEDSKNSNEMVTIKVFSSLTCPHCANFHQEVILKLKKDYIDTNRVRFEHHSFPLDLAALNAEKILNCLVNKEKDFDFLTQIYKKQRKWTAGSDINLINDSLKMIGKEFGLSDKSMDRCLNDKKIEDKILDERISAQKKYKISSTPSIFINEKQYEGKHNFELFKKELNKLF